MFIQVNKLYFGCLRPGHCSKECEKQGTCDTCNKKHPTCLHENRTSDAWLSASLDRSVDRDNSMEERMGSTQDKAVSVSSGATSNRIMQDIKGTHTPTVYSCGCQLLMNLVYALLDTQSDTTFILKETAEALNAKSEPVQLSCQPWPQGTLECFFRN